MVGAQSDWWNQNTPQDQVLLALIEIIVKLGHLPTIDENFDPKTNLLVRQCITYFGSFENACREAARFLYGHKELTSPDELLPRERELPETEQAEILAARRDLYAKRIAESKTRGALGRWRKETSKKFVKPKIPEGYVIRRIPIKTTHEMLALHDKANRSVSGTTGFTQKRTQKFAKKKFLTAQEQWARARKYHQSYPTEASTPKPYSKPNPQPAKCDQKEVQQISNTSSTSAMQPFESDAKKEVKKMGNKPRRSRDELLEMLSRMEQYFGKIPSMSQIREYTREHEDERIAHPTTFSRTLGDKDTWAEQLSLYRLAQQGDTQSDNVGEEANIPPNPPEPPIQPPATSELPIPSVAPNPSTLPAPTDDMEATDPVQPSEPDSTVPPEEQTTSVPRKKAIHINLSSVLLRFQMGGEDYELEIEFGPAANA